MFDMPLKSMNQHTSHFQSSNSVYTFRKERIYHYTITPAFENWCNRLYTYLQEEEIILIATFHELNMRWENEIVSLHLIHIWASYRSIDKAMQFQITDVDNENITNISI